MNNGNAGGTARLGDQRRRDPFEANGDNLIVFSPTSSGKTVVADTAALVVGTTPVLYLVARGGLARKADLPRAGARR